MVKVYYRETLDSFGAAFFTKQRYKDDCELIHWRDKEVARIGLEEIEFTTVIPDYSHTSAVYENMRKVPASDHLVQLIRDDLFGTALARESRLCLVYLKILPFNFSIWEDTVHYPHDYRWHERGQGVLEYQKYLKRKADEVTSS